MNKNLLPLTHSEELQRLSQIATAFQLPLCSLLSKQSIEVVIPNVELLTQSLEKTLSNLDGAEENEYTRTLNNKLAKIINALNSITELSLQHSYTPPTDEQIYLNLYLVVEQLSTLSDDYIKLEELTHDN